MNRVNHETQSLQKACHEATEAYTEDIQPDPRMMQSVAEHQEVPKEEAVVMPIGRLRKRRRGQNLAAERRHKPKKRIRGYCGSRKRVTVAERKMTRCAAVHGAGNTGFRDKEKTIWHREPRRDGRPG
jgi:hypothetical protein